MTPVVNKASSKRWPHQAKEYLVGRNSRSRAYIWPMRSGKSRACIDVGCYQHRQKKVEGIIVVAPNGVHMNWAVREIPTWGWPGINHRSFVWETPKRGTPEKERDWDAFIVHRGLKWFCINMESLAHEDCKRAINRFITRCHHNFGLIVSEAHHFGRAGSKRTNKARGLSYHATFVRTETGTPILTGPLRAFSQYELLAPGALGFSRYLKFEEHFADMVPMGAPGTRTRKKVDKYKNLDELTAKIGKWSSLVLRSDLKDMPELIQTERPIVMNEQQRRAYLQMVAVHLAEVEEGEVEAPDAGPRMMKLQQILSGYIMDTPTKRILTIDEDAPLYAATIEQIRGTLPGKPLIWCRYKEDCRRLAAKLKAIKMPSLAYWGDFPTREREANRMMFLDPNDDRPMIGTPDCGGEGLDFSTGDAVIFMSVPPNARMIAQAQERATIKGGKSVAVVRMRHYGTVDDRMWDIIDGNTSLADTVTGSGLRKLLTATDV